MLVFAVNRSVELGAVVSTGIVLVAKAAGPAEQRTHGRAVAGDLNISVKNVRLVEGERLADLRRAVRIGESQRGRRSERAGRRRNIETPFSGSSVSAASYV